MLDTDFNILKITRNNIKNLVSSCSLAELNTIPAGFNNNLIWNYGHIIVTQQLLCYGLSGVEMYTDNELVTKYRKGSRPSDVSPVSQSELDQLNDLLTLTTENIELDYKAGKFKEYKEYTTSYNMTLKSTEDAIRFNNVHESMHLGQCILIKKFI